MTKRKEMAYRPMDTAPRDGTPILALIEGEGEKEWLIHLEHNFISTMDEDAEAWVITSHLTECDAPPSWTDGVCWEFNEDGERSAQPLCWRPTERGSDDKA